MHLRELNIFQLEQKMCSSPGNCESTLLLFIPKEGEGLEASGGR